MAAHGDFNCRMCHVRAFFRTKMKVVLERDTLAHIKPTRHYSERAYISRPCFRVEIVAVAAELRARKYMAGRQPRAIAAMIPDIRPGEECIGVLGFQEAPETLCILQFSVLAQNLFSIFSRSTLYFMEHVHNVHSVLNTLCFLAYRHLPTLFLPPPVYRNKSQALPPLGLLRNGRSMSSSGEAHFGSLWGHLSGYIGGQVIAFSIQQVTQPVCPYPL
ncbi:hypothetical protein GGS23DRAFT_371017 [Durotheca rogersii]|uniref:uncharacterized protein n=1 Tax=Durotheca rogersii TaxID=419775 RepID=UPI00222100EB|nr:uncharacterized protein GGS23DRAFT_371017 [Durotheca rogersii]KAI5866136.1 hypothetical protein GGS23DRAFT_371017 [Durotheca rogersii]